MKPLGSNIYLLRILRMPAQPTIRPQGGTLEDLAKERRFLLWRIILANYHVKPAAKHAIKVRYGL